ncbi:MAG: oligosaccharide flippase family protein [Candidatus Koribacter versatilis]|uniref:Oligosaccharide flippase family protein n=1 Tax=Candidatus Korobacter versatilis TaxID=658062 RepID=A0A932ENT6_9BACT|nr:oligosaccharide flippase family protein [Candidatus Koribacter versatilis]
MPELSELEPQLSAARPLLVRWSEALGAVDSPLRRRLVGGAFWSVLDAGFKRGFALLISIVVARAMGREVFGEFGLVQSTVGMFGLFAGLGMSVTATKYVAELRASDPLRLGRILGLSRLVAVISGAAMTLVLVATAPWLARTTLAAPGIGWPLQLGCGLLFFGVVNGTVLGALYGFERFKAVAFVDGIAGLLGFGAVVLGLRTHGLPGAIVGLVVGVALQGIGYWICLSHELRHSKLPVIYRGCTAEWRVLPRFSAPALLAVAMTGPVAWVCSTILVNQPGGYAQLGLFNAANQWHSLVLFLPLTLSAPFLPVLSSLFGTEPAKYMKVLTTGILANTLVALVAAGAVILLSRPIMASYGSSFVSGVPALVLLVLAAVISAAVWCVGQAIASSGNMWWGFALNLVWAVALVSFLWLFRQSGAYGYALATLIAYGIHVFTSAYVFWRIHPRARTGA